MSNITHGMNVDEVEALGRLLQSKADQLRHVVTDLEAALGRTMWEGPDAAAFKQQWWPDHRARLTGVADQVHGFGQSALNNVSEQRTASGEALTRGGVVPRMPWPNVIDDLGENDPVLFGKSAVMPERSWQEVQQSYDAWATGRFAEGGVSHYQCTGWANFRWQELGYDGIISGNGGAMAGNAGPLSTDPSMHAMASYGAGTSADPGHVMVVEEISGDGSRIRVSEMNTGTDGSGWEVGNPQEYRDTKWITRGADGTFRSWNGKVIQFAAFPG